MCGITGLLYADRRSIDRTLLRAMNETLVHRGPDGDGIHDEPGMGLAHRRLSIIDLSGGSQPMCNESGDVWISFNGEIYNFHELKRQLEARGHRFATVSDTETIVHAYEEYGEDCVSHLSGMFAFAIWDARQRKLFLARDRVGIKPLYYYCDGRRLLFASELKAILADPAVPRELDMRALADYLVYGYIPLNKTIFREVKKLLPGHWAAVTPDLKLDRLQTQVRQYWDLQFAPDPDRSEAEWLDGLEQLLCETIKSHMISDVPLGAFLSGGLDSSCVVALMAKLSPCPVRTFTIGFSEPEFNELPFARQIAEQYGTDHYEMVVRPDAIELLPELARQFDEPFGDSSAIPTYYVSRLARRHVTVALSGDGGDEAFAGYRRYAHTMAALRNQRRLAFVPRVVRRHLGRVLADHLPASVRGRGTLRRLGMSPAETYLNVAYFHESSFLTDLLHADVQSLLQYGDGDSLTDYFESLDGDDLSRMQYLDTKTYLPEDILTKVDRTSMLTSLEARVPLLDHRVLEFAARIPPGLKFRQGKGKYIFRKLLQKLLPEPLLTRPKMGFGVPLVHWFKLDLTAYTREVLLAKQSRERGLFDSSAVEAILAEHCQGRIDRSDDIWRLLMLEHWCRHYLDVPIAVRS
jgi:asparagine synthase (glutamine-hydrolysing)